ncbi:hypothetical protein RRF57_010787 [Xylaria bambusicola]|uniref:NAD-specific glutamate dehydrogenase n=1 Tax=Xylaria bambusicola TaxID=326684 RepID=A0AAN7Z323_9PEZI
MAVRISHHVGLLELRSGFGLDLVRLGVGRLLLGFAVDGCLDDVRGTQTLEFCCRTFDLDVLLQVLIPRLGSSSSLDPSDVDVTAEIGLLRSQVGLGRGTLDVSVRLLHGRLGVDLGNLTFLLTASVGLADVSAELGVCDVDTGLVRGALVGLLRERLEVRGADGVFELLDVGVVDLEAELVELALNVAEDAALEFLPLGEDLFHGHAGHQHSGFTLDNALDDVLEHGILHERVPAILVLGMFPGRRIGYGSGVGTARVDVTVRGS